jgi:hypothetical protein
LQSADLYFPSLIRRHLLRPPVPPGTRTTTYTLEAAPHLQLEFKLGCYLYQNPKSPFINICCTVYQLQPNISAAIACVAACSGSRCTFDILFTPCFVSPRLHWKHLSTSPPQSFVGICVAPKLVESIIRLFAPADTRSSLADSILFLHTLRSLVLHLRPSHDRALTFAHPQQTHHCQERCPVG